MSPYVEVIFRSLIAYSALLVVARLIGQKFSVVVGIGVASVVAFFSLDRTIPVVDGLIALVTWGICYTLTQFISLKSMAFRSFVNGTPTVLIEQGNVLEKNLRKARITVNDMMALLREQNAFKLSDVELGTLEADGQMSVMKKSGLDPITPTLQGMQVETEHSPHVLIVDGKEVAQTLTDLGISHGWLLLEVQKQGARDIRDVFLAQIDSKGNLYVDLYNESKKPTKLKERPLLLASLKKIQADLESFSLQTDDKEAKVLYQDQAKVLKNLITQVTTYLRE